MNVQLFRTVDQVNPIKNMVIETQQQQSNKLEMKRFWRWLGRENGMWHKIKVVHSIC